MTIYRVPARIDYTMQGGPGMNIWHVRTVSSDVDDERNALGAALDALQKFYQDVGSFWPSGTQFTLGEGMIRDPLGDPTYAQDDPRRWTADPSTGTPSTMLALVVSWRTASATRSGRGRTFVGPLTSVASDADGTPAAGALVRVRNAAAALVDASDNANGWAIGVLSTKQGIIRDVTGYSVRDRWSYLSSRRD